MQALGCRLRREGKVVALVPTMGALHEGHLSLMRRARAESDALVVSIFVNPFQFGPGEDYQRYPRNLEGDLELLRPLAPEAVFAPSEKEMYPAGFGTHVEPHPLAARLEGAFRPHHFRSVATAVLKLLNIVGPTRAYFGQKDFQQAAMIRRMAKDLNLHMRVIVCPTVREADGLALSSRNAYLGVAERRSATVLSRSLNRAQALFRAGETRGTVLVEAMRAILETEPSVTVDYCVVVDPGSMEDVGRAAPGTVALVAARVGSTRLIDNLILGPAGVSDDDLLDLASGACRDSMSPSKD